MAATNSARTPVESLTTNAGHTDWHSMTEAGPVRRTGTEPRTEDTVIELRRVGKTYGKTPVIEDLSLQIRRGEFLTLLGPSGCGKTTTLKMVAGFEPPTCGQIVLEGRDVSGVPPYARNLNTVFQQYALFPHMTVFENVAFGPRTRRVKNAEVKLRVENMLEMVHMLEHAAKKPNQLSGGQQQRVALARALVNYPSALLLDEPLSALDVKLRRAMQLELKKIQAQVQTTFIFVTHDQEEALTMSTRIAVMNAGRIEQLGSPETIYHKPATPFVANFIGETNLIECTVKSQQSNETTVTLPDGTSVTLSSQVPAVNGVAHARLLLRPEHAQISLDARHDWDFALKLEIISRSFRGSALHVDMLTPWKQILQLQVPPKTSSAEAITNRTSVFVHWPTEARWLVVGT